MKIVNYFEKKNIFSTRIIISNKEDSMIYFSKKKKSEFKRILNNKAKILWEKSNISKKKIIFLRLDGFTRKHCHVLAKIIVHLKCIMLTRP